MLFEIGWGGGGDWKGELFLIVTRRTVGFRSEGPQVRGPFHSFFPSRNNVTLSLTDCGIISLLSTIYAFLLTFALWSNVINGDK